MHFYCQFYNAMIAGKMYFFGGQTVKSRAMTTVVDYEQVLEEC